VGGGRGAIRLTASQRGVHAVGSGPNWYGPPRISFGRIRQARTYPFFGPGLHFSIALFFAVHSCARAAHVLAFHPVLVSACSEALVACVSNPAGFSRTATCAWPLRSSQEPESRPSCAPHACVRPVRQRSEPDATGHALAGHGSAAEASTISMPVFKGRSPTTRIRFMRPARLDHHGRTSA